MGAGILEQVIWSVPARSRSQSGGEVSARLTDGARPWAPDDSWISFVCAGDPGDAPPPAALNCAFTPPGRTAPLDAAAPTRAGPSQRTALRLGPWSSRSPAPS